jgi:hypothetical protein
MYAVSTLIFLSFHYIKKTLMSDFPILVGKGKVEFFETQY